MKKAFPFYLHRFSWLLLLCVSVAYASDEVPCFVFSGNADNQHCIDLSQLNRIAFNKDEMIISSSNNDEDKSVSLKYTHYHHLTIANAIPTNTIGVDLIPSSSSFYINYINADKSLLVIAEEEQAYELELFNLKGEKIYSCRHQTSNSISLTGLPVGVYIAVAHNSHNQALLKFIIH